jgi:hypothetical protein
MKAEDLRIGNLVMDNAKVKIVTSGMISNWDIIKKDYGGYKPIPLTEEWLVRFGFEKNKENRWMTEKSRYALFYFEYYATGEEHCMWRIEYRDTDYGKNEYKDCQQFGDRIKHVHQLQNLYFALTGEELTLNETI